MYGPKTISPPVGAIVIHPGDDVSAIVNNAPAGATFFFEVGVYRGASLTPKEGQTFIGERGAVLNGSALLTNFTQEGSHWVIGGQTQEGFRQATGSGEAGSMRAGYPETVYIDDKPLTPVDALSKLGPGNFYFDYAADKIYLGDNPVGHKVEAGTLDHAFEGSANGVTVQNFVVEKYNSPTQSGAIQGNQNWTITDNEVRLNYGLGMRAEDNSKMIGNFVHDNGQMGVGGSGDNLLVEGNEIARNGWWSGIDVFWEGGGSKFAETDGLSVRSNYSHDNKGFGLWTDINNINTLYEGNVIVHNSGGGINHEISYDAIIRNNVLMGNGYQPQGDWLWGAQIQIQNSSNVEAYGNRVDMTGAQGGNGIALIQQNRPSSDYGGSSPNHIAPWTTTGNNIHDNIVVSKDGNGSVGGAADYNAAGMLNGGNVWNSNTYYMPDGDHFWWHNTHSFAGFKAATGETGPISQAYPNTDDWVTVSGAETLPSDPASGDPGTDPGDPGTDPGDPGTDPGDPGTDPGDPGTDPGDPGTNPGDTVRYESGDSSANDLWGSELDDVLMGRGGSDRLAGGLGIDRLSGGRGSDVLFGGAGDDEIRGGGGRDILQGDAGADLINGGSGEDVLLLSGTISDYTIDVAGHSVRLTNAAGETDAVRGVEQFHFLDDSKTYSVEGDALVKTGLQSLLDEAGAWDALQAQQVDIAQLINTGLAEIIELDLASGPLPAASTPDPAPSSAVDEIDASTLVDHSIGLTADDHDRILG